MILRSGSLKGIFGQNKSNLPNLFLYPNNKSSVIVVGKDTCSPLFSRNDHDKLKSVF